MVQMSELKSDILPSLVALHSDAVLLIEEDHQVARNGTMLRKEGRYLKESKVNVKSYFNFIESVRKSGIRVVTTRSLNHSIHWMAAQHSYLEQDHLPKAQARGYSSLEEAMGAIRCIDGFGNGTAKKVLQQKSLREIASCSPKELKQLGLNQSQINRLLEVMNVKGDT
jgi:hypothetical protein